MEENLDDVTSGKSNSSNNSSDMFGTLSSVLQHHFVPILFLWHPAFQVPIDCRVADTRGSHRIHFWEPVSNDYKEPQASGANIHQ